MWDGFLHYKIEMQSSTTGQGWDLSGSIQAQGSTLRDLTGGLGTLAAHILGTVLNGDGR